MKVEKGGRPEESRREKTHTTVMLSTLSMNGSDVRYRESDRAYSFQSWANRFCDEATVAWLKTK